ncbi:MAG: 1-acyl-sn-glycerol-3-phosphate acyltransferase [Alistipes sp.]|nr:1-acyl-sn-glycerol-3-phosphate acyltransferase [Alistipes sp.]
MAKKEKKVQDYNALYDFLRYYVDFILKLSYRTVRYVGREKIPQDGAVIYAPNHTNALMDALVILAMDHKPKVFVARADIFRNRTYAKILHFLKIMPIMRIRDGFDEVKKNHETIEKSVDVLRDRIPFCIFPEGQHQAKYSSLPLSKGIFRIAFQAQELMPDLPLYIVPVGIRYGSFFRFRSTVRIQIGDPINVREFIDSHSEYTPQEQMNIVREILAENMRSSIFHINNDEDYDATYEICAAVVKNQVRRIMRKNNISRMNRLDAHFQANQATVEYINSLKENEPEKAAKLLQLGNEASVIRKSKRISLASVSIKFPVLSRILKILFVLAVMPYCLLAGLLTLPIKLLCNYIFTKLKDYAFRNSIRFLLNLVLWPLLMIIYSIITYIILPWQWALPITLALLPAPIVTHETWRLLRLGISDIRLLCDKKLRSKYAQIRAIIFNK